MQPMLTGPKTTCVSGLTCSEAADRVWDTDKLRAEGILSKWDAKHNRPVRDGTTFVEQEIDKIPAEEYKGMRREQVVRRLEAYLKAGMSKPDSIERLRGSLRSKRGPRRTTWDLLPEASWVRSTGLPSHVPAARVSLNDNRSGNVFHIVLFPVSVPVNTHNSTTPKFGSERYRIKMECA
eukprot:COSAG02_NODE_2381_length_8995_cov_3.430980_9_plen_179_part_00